MTRGIMDGPVWIRGRRHIENVPGSKKGIGGITERLYAYAVGVKVVILGLPSVFD